MGPGIGFDRAFQERGLGRQVLTLEKSSNGKSRKIELVCLSGASSQTWAVGMREAEGREYEEPEE